MGNCQKKIKIFDKKLSNRELDFSNTYISIDKENREDKIKRNVDNVFEEIKDIKNLDIKGKMLLSETTGNPKELYLNLLNLAHFNYGRIKKVMHKITGRVRAEKQIKKELIEIKEEESLIFKELALLRTLDHPNIIKLYEFYKDDKFFYLISDYCDEGELFKIIKKEPNGFDEITVAHIMKQLLSVVNYCHILNIIHRDLRPEHILVDSVEYQYINKKRIPLYSIKVSDFKSARTFKTSKKLNKKVGNPYFIAPEVLNRKYNEKCDLWSCGIIMYILLTSKPPFSGNTDTEVLAKVKSGVFEYFDNDLKNNSIECKSLLKELLRSDPSKRPSAAQAMNHNWFEIKKINIELSRDFVHESFNNLLNFSSDLKFQQSVLAYMVHHLINHDEIKEIKQMFYVFDSDNDGRLSHEEITKGFKRYIGIIPNEKHFNKIIRKIDQDKCGFIDYEEFIRAVINKRKLLSENSLRMFFRLFDKEESNLISLLELKKTLQLSSKYDHDVWNEIFSDIEHYKNNVLTYDEFIKIMIELIK